MDPKARVVVGVGTGGAVLLAVVWVLWEATVGSSATTDLPEVFWLIVLFGAVVAWVLATSVALRLWGLVAEGLGRSGSGRNGVLRSRGPAHAAADGDAGHAERRLLKAIDRHGEITPARAALEAGLTVAEADRMLGGLAEKGHLEVRARDGKLVYSF